MLVDLLAQYLYDDTFLADREVAQKIRHQASRYVLHEDKLYNRYFFPTIAEMIVIFKDRIHSIGSP